MNQNNHTTTTLDHSPIKTSADLTAYAVHSLGYWPAHSLVLIAANVHGIGPCLRADMLSETEPEERLEFLAQLIDMIPETDRDARPFTSIFCLMFGDTTTAEAQDIHSGRSWSPNMELIQQDARQVARAQEWLEPLYSARGIEKYDLKCALFIATYTRWHTNDPQAEFAFEGFIDEVITSTHYAEMIAAGSNPASTAEENASRPHWDVWSTREPEATQQWEEDATFWAQSYRCMTADPQRYCLDYTAQKTQEFSLWEQALVAITTLCDPALRDEYNQHWADAIRATVPAEVAGFLSSTLTSMGTAQMLLGLTCAGKKVAVAALRELDAITHHSTDPSAMTTLLRPQQSVLTLEQKSQLAHHSPQCHPGEKSLDTIASYLMGTSPYAPQWARLEALEILLNILHSVATEDVVARITAILGWVQWLRGSSSQAHALLQVSKHKLHEPEFIAYEEAINHNFLPLWCKAGREAWRGREFDLAN